MIIRIIQNKNRKYHNNQSKICIQTKHRQKYIQDLQQRNRKLKNQIQKITEILEENQEKQKQKKISKNYVSNIGHSLQQNNPDALKKQLQNIYKQIKTYQREIQKLQNNRSGSRISSDQIARLQMMKYQKLQHLDKLKNQLSALNNLQALNSKKLKNNIGKQYYENLIIKLGDGLNVLRQKVRVLQQKEKKKIANAKKQLDYIKKLQGQLVQSGVPMDQIQELKRNNVYTQIKNIMNREKDDQKQGSGQKVNDNSQDQQQQQIVTFQKLEQMKNQIKLYKKLHQDYQKRIISTQKQKQSCDKQIIEKKQLAGTKNAQIQKLTQQISEVKQLVRKNNNVTNGTIAAGQPDSIRKLQRKKSVEVNLSGAKNKSQSKEGKKNIHSTAQKNISSQKQNKK